ncbi:MAG: SDR family oxidoreductase [Candidatus Acidiferrales bacterium]
MILVTGASGTAGKAVLAEVARSGAKHRAMYRSKTDAAKAPTGTETVIADFADNASLAAALRGIDSVYLVCSPVRELVELEGNAIDACVAAGVRRVVLNSALGAAGYPKSFPSWHRKVEDKLNSTKMARCIIRPNSFSQNVLTYNAPSIRQQGAFYGSLGNARISYVDVRDIATVLAKALQGGEHDGKIYELNGPEALTNADIAEKISRHAGVPVRYVDIPEDAQRTAMLDQGMPEWQVTALLDLQRYYTSGQGGTVDTVLEKLLGRAPIKKDEFLAEVASEFRPQAARA